MNLEKRFFSSAIVGGTCPIAAGIAMGIKRRGEGNHVWCFVGDMTAETGAFHEALKYSQHFGLPIIFVLEDNGISTTTPTGKAWGGGLRFPFVQREPVWLTENLMGYKYKSKYPHQGIGKFIQF